MFFKAIEESKVNSCTVLDYSSYISTIETKGLINNHSKRNPSNLLLAMLHIYRLLDQLNLFQLPVCFNRNILHKKILRQYFLARAIK